MNLSQNDSPGRESTSLYMISSSITDATISQYSNTESLNTTTSDRQQTNHLESKNLNNCNHNNPASGDGGVNLNDSILADKSDVYKMTIEDADLRAQRMDMTFDYLDAFSLVFSMFSFLLDFVTDIVVAIFHYLNQDYWYSALTATFIFVPNTITSCISMRWYLTDSKGNNAHPVGRFQWTLRIIFHILQVGPILRYYESLSYGLKFMESKDPKERKTAYFRMIYEDADAALLRLFESFMESTPQLMLQMYIMTRNYPFDDYEYWTVIFQIISICSSLISISWSLVSYSKSLRISLSTKIPMTYTSIGVMFSWELLTVTGRMIALALYTSSFVRSVGFILFFHWVCMTAWIVSMKTKFCDTRCEELGFNAVLGVIFIFSYFNPVDSITRYRYIAFYLFMFCENSILMYTWAKYATYKLWIKKVALLSHYSAFFLGLILMVSLDHAKEFLQRNHILI